MADLTAMKQEFWGDLQADLFTKNTAVYLADQSLSSLISQNGKKAHKPVLSHPQTGSYTSHSDISFEEKDSKKQTISVDTFEYAAEDIDITEQYQTEEDLVQHSTNSIRKGLSNRVEQNFLDEITNAHHVISGGSAQSLSYDSILGLLEEAEGDLGAYDAPYETGRRALVLGPRSVATLRRSKSERSTNLGDSSLQNGVIGPWQGWTVVQNNNLPWSGNVGFTNAQPAAGDTVTIAGVTFTFVNGSTSNPGEVDNGSLAADAATNLVDAINGDSGNYTDIGIRDNFMLRRKRNITASEADSEDSVDVSGYGDIATSSNLTNSSDGWTGQEQEAVFMIRGAIDMVLQFMKLEVGNKEKGFADLPKGIIGLGTKTFDDGSILMEKMNVDASGF